MRALLPILALATLAFSLGESSTAASPPAVFEVSGTADTIDAAPGDGACRDADGDCTLRAAVQEANALPGPQAIQLGPGTYEIALSGCCEVESANGDFDILDDTTIIGAGSELTFVTRADSAFTERIFDIAQNTVVTISNLSLGGVFMNKYIGEEEKCGGGVRNAGALTFKSGRVRGNIIRGSGGGICNLGDGVLWVYDSVIEENEAALLGAGGGILNSGRASLDRVVVRSNRAFGIGGGGIANYGDLVLGQSVVAENMSDFVARPDAGGIRTAGPNSSALIINSTVTSNQSSGFNEQADSSVAGGVSSAGGSLAVVGSTVRGNRAPESGTGGISTLAGDSTTVANSIIAENDGPDCSSDTVPTSLGHNLDSDGTCQLSGPGDISDTDPLLGPLADNGGPTFTHALLPGSPAIDAGDPAQCPEADQRGAPRDAACDIGAFEAGAVVPTPGPAPRGDLDCDGVVTLIDALYALGSAAGAVSLPQCEGETGDVDCDGDIDGVDGLLIVKQVADLPVEACALS